MLLLAPWEGIGTLKLAVVGGSGMTTTPMPGFIGGWESEQDDDAMWTRQKIPALVVDEVAQRALVVSGRAVAEIYLRNLGVRQHTLSEPVSLSAAYETGSSRQPTRSSSTGPGATAPGSVTGYSQSRGEDYSSEGGRDHDAELGDVTGYDLGGDKVFELLPKTSVWLQVVGGYVYAVHESSKRFTIIDRALGRVAGTAKTEEPLTLVEG